MDYWIVITVKAQKMNGTTLFSQAFLLTYSQGLKKVAAELKVHITNLFKKAWNVCREDESDEKAKMQLSKKSDCVGG
jgi:hypothetical protein